MIQLVSRFFFRRYRPIMDLTLLTNSTEASISSLRIATLSMLNPTGMPFSLQKL